MIPLATLQTTVQRALQKISRIKDVQEGEVFASSTGHFTCRLNYTSEIPCNGVEEPKSFESFGIGIRAVFKGTDDNGPRVGFASEARDFSPGAIHRALEKARQNAVPDPEFVSLPAPAETSQSTKEARRLTRYHDPAIMDLKGSTLVEAGWKVINEALKTFTSSPQLAALAGAKDSLASLGLIVGGDVSLIRQRIAIASTRIPKVQTDESTLLTSLVTAMVERQNAKGSGYSATTHLAKFRGEAGSEAARNAIEASEGRRIPSGTYAAILGPQPVNDLMVNLVLPSLSADTFYACRSAFLGEIGRPIASKLLTIYDHGVARGMAASKKITCEGLPTGRTDLIKQGILTGLLSNHYETQRLLRDQQTREKLGLNLQDHPEVLVPRNGFRVSGKGGRQFDVTPSIAATNVFIEGSVPHTTDSLLRLVGNGVYIGRIWYTYAMNGLRAGDFTCTVVGDSYRIEDGRVGAPIPGNALRITGNIRQVLQNILGITKEARPVVGWGADEVVYAPEIAVQELHLTEIAQFMETM
ncbi:MAG TPA: TldD/PmbA family protein [Nitrospiraceae bacterium]|nr:TldD/PmbA family protein [Nitrospiraceae bacterium]